MPLSPMNPSILALFASKRFPGVTMLDLITDYTETHIYVGLNDADARQQLHETESYIETLKRVCIDYGTAFSFDVVNGGYIHDDGEYTEEKTIVLTLIDAPKETVDGISQDLCKLFHQESVLVTIGLVKARMVHAAQD